MSIAPPIVKYFLSVWRFFFEIRSRDGSTFEPKFFENNDQVLIEINCVNKSRYATNIAVNDIIGG